MQKDIALEAIRKSTLTDPVADADAERDPVYQGFVLLIQTYAYSTNPGRVKAGRNILEIKQNLHRRQILITRANEVQLGVIKNELLSEL